MAQTCAPALLIFFCACALITTVLARQQPTTSNDLAAAQRELLRRLSLSPPTHPAAAPLSSADINDLVQRFTQADLKKRQEAGGPVPSGLTPLVIVPSLLGSRLQAQLNHVQTSHWYCWTEWRDWFTVWVDFVEIALMNCWTERMSLHLDERSGRSYNTPGVEVSYIDYGGVDGVTYIDDWGYLGMWNTTVKIMTSLGWTVGKNLRAAPYDFRFGPQTWKEEDWPRLRALIEHTSAINNNSKVACVSESMGGPYFLGFLNQQTPAWKDRFIHSYTSIDGAFGGSSSALSTLISSTGFWSNMFYDPAAIKTVTQTWPSIMWMLPLAQVYGDDHVWVSTLHPARNYTTADLQQLLIDAGGLNASKLYRILQANNWLTFEAPGVECHAFYGTGVPTIVRSTYNTTRFDDVPVVEFGDGDGTVPELGLRMLERWRGRQAQPIYGYAIHGLTHGAGPQNKQALRMFLDILSSPK